MLTDLQFLPASKKRESDLGILLTHLETLLSFSSRSSSSSSSSSSTLKSNDNKEARNTLRQAGVYYVVREVHLRVEDDSIRELCERLVQILMGEDDDVEEEAS